MSTEERLARIEEQLLNLGGQLARVLTGQETAADRLSALELVRARAEGALAGGRLVAGLVGGAAGAGLVEALRHLS